MPEPRKVTIRCDCDLKLRVAIPDGMAEGARIQVTCKCGQKLRFRAPGEPKWFKDFMAELKVLNEKMDKGLI